MEYWKPIVGFEGLYEISNKGRVRRVAGNHCRKTRMLKPGANEFGYLYVCLWKKGVQKPRRVNRLVAIHYMPNPRNLPEVNHKFGNKKDNREESLEWSTVSDNRKHAYKTDLNPGRWRLKNDSQG